MSPQFYVQVSEALVDHPKTTRAIRALRVNRLQFVGHLVCLWSWALKHAPDGDLSGFSARDLADAARWTDRDDFEAEADEQADRFIAALLGCSPSEGGAGFLERTADGALRVHGWDEWGGKLDEKRERNAFRQWQHRWKEKGAAPADTPENWARFRAQMPPTEAGQAPPAPGPKRPGTPPAPSGGDDNEESPSRNGYVTVTSQPKIRKEKIREEKPSQAKPEVINTTSAREAPDGGEGQPSRLAAAGGSPLPGDSPEAAPEAPVRPPIPAPRPPAPAAGPPQDRESQLQAMLAADPEGAEELAEWEKRKVAGGEYIGNPIAWRWKAYQTILAQRKERAAAAAESPQAAREKAAEVRVVEAPRPRRPLDPTWLPGVTEEEARSCLNAARDALLARRDPTPPGEERDRRMVAEARRIWQGRHPDEAPGWEPEPPYAPEPEPEPAEASTPPSPRAVPVRQLVAALAARAGMPGETASVEMAA